MMQQMTTELTEVYDPREETIRGESVPEQAGNNEALFNISGLGLDFRGTSLGRAFIAHSDIGQFRSVRQRDQLSQIFNLRFLLRH